jgi:hypothetical protein
MLLRVVIADIRLSDFAALETKQLDQPLKSEAIKGGKVDRF